MKSTTPLLVAPYSRVAEHQPQYEAVTVARLNNPQYPGGPAHPNSVVMAFELDPDERARIAYGAAIYITLLTFGNPQQPVLITVGEDEMAAVFGVATRPREDEPPDPTTPRCSPPASTPPITNAAAIGAARRALAQMEAAYASRLTAGKPWLVSRKRWEAETETLRVQINGLRDALEGKSPAFNYMNGETQGR